MIFYIGAARMEPTDVTFYRWIPMLLKFKLILAMTWCFLTGALTCAPSLYLSREDSGWRCGLSIPWVFPGGFLEQDHSCLIQNQWLPSYTQVQSHKTAWVCA